ncbi:cysteinyl-tRNA synthetase [Xenococcus sp. PCC 7305]|uniref:hypothetical protein n=1 Tax=Xenococcus sp. PCC 7305 TaxID=102125 RepID=UPI0002AC203B|nr:hypothetical protein [Xenococcus sp. PCC 7305]ELS00968.1 cysteinyl-tRNA synthetase [Xenococcus sp. PCC 7305]
MTEIANEEMRRKLGNLTQIRELLFGEQIEDYDSRFQQYQKQITDLESNVKSLESNLEQFKLDQQQRIEQLQNDLSHEISTAINALEKKLQYLGLNTSNEVTKLTKSIETKTQRNSQIIDAVSKRFETQNQQLREEIAQTKTGLEKDLSGLKKELLELLEQDLANFSKDNLSRHELADLLFGICMKIKKTDVNPELFGSTQNNQEIQAELILPGDSNS